MRVHSLFVTGSVRQSGNEDSYFLGNVAINKTSADNPLEVEGIISASYFYGDGTNLTGIPALLAGETIPGDLRVTGDIIAEQLIISSSVVNLTTNQLSGSTHFGDTIDDTHQFSGSLYVSGTLQVNGVSVITSADQIASAISGAFTSDSASFSSRITANEVVTAKTLISGSGQIASDISGAFTADSASIQSRLSDVELITAKTLLSSSFQIESDISGAFASVSASIQGRLSDIEVITAKTLISSSFQIESDISGAFTAVSASLSGRIETNESDLASLYAKTLISSSAQFNSLTAPFSGSFSGSFSGDGSGLTNLPGGLSPGGANTQIQYNDNGSLGGLPNFTINETTKVIYISGSVVDASLSTMISGSIISASNFWGDGSGLFNIATSSIVDFNTEVSRSAAAAGFGAGGAADHGALTGLSDDDHTQYVLADGSRNIAGAGALNFQVRSTDSTSQLTVSGSNPKFLLSDDDPGGIDYSLRSDGGGFYIKNESSDTDEIYMDSDGHFGIGAMPPAESALYVASGSSGTNVDIRHHNGGGSSTVEMQHHDYDSTFKSTYLQYVGESVAGNVMGDVPNADLAQLVFQGPDRAAIYTTNASDIILGTDYQKRIIISGSGVTVFLSASIVPEDPYSTTWDNSNEVPTKNDIYDKIEAISASFDTRLNNINVGGGVLSSSFQIESDISGAFTAVSASLSSRIETNETDLSFLYAKTLISSSFQIESDISGAFALVSGSLASRITSNTSNVNALYAKTLISSSAQFRTITAPFTGSFTGSFEGNGSGLTGVIASPAGSSGEVQYNRSGVLSATSSFVYDDTATKLTLTQGTGTYLELQKVNGAFYMMALNQTGNSGIDINPIPSDGAGSAYFRFFRSTNTTGNTYFDVLRGDGTSTNVNHRFSGKGALSSYLCALTGSATTNKLGIGKSSPSVKLDISGSTYITGSLKVSGNVFAQTYTETSAVRFKENIDSFEDGDIVYKLRPVTFTWKNTGKEDIGLIAEEVHEIIPEIVEKQGDDIYGINYSKITALLIKTVQDQKKEIDILKEEIKQIKKLL